MCVPTQLALQAPLPRNSRPSGPPTTTRCAPPAPPNSPGGVGRLPASPAGPPRSARTWLSQSCHAPGGPSPRPRAPPIRPRLWSRRGGGAPCSTAPAGRRGPGSAPPPGRAAGGRRRRVRPDVTTSDTHSPAVTAAAPPGIAVDGTATHPESGGRAMRGARVRTRWAVVEPGWPRRAAGGSHPPPPVSFPTAATATAPPLPLQEAF